MLQPRPLPALGARAEHQLAVHKLAMAVHDFVWWSLDRLRVPAVDRDDIAQDVMVDVLRDWRSYRADAGAPGQWLWGITRNHVRAYWRKRGKQPVLIDGELPAGRPSEAPTPEEIVATERLLAGLPPLQRRVVMLYEFAGCTYREIADLVGISKSEAERRHKAGRRAIVAAVERSDGRGACVLPLTVAALFGDDATAGPPPEAVARAWERVVAEGLADLETPPSSGPRRRGAGKAARPPSPRLLPQRRRWGRFGTRGALLLAGVLMAAMLAPDDGPRTRSVAAVTTTATAGATTEAEQRLPRDPEEAPPPSPPARTGWKAIPPSDARIALPHHPNGLAHVRDLLSAAGAQLPGGDVAAPRGAGSAQ